MTMHWQLSIAELEQAVSKSITSSLLSKVSRSWISKNASILPQENWFFEKSRNWHSLAGGNLRKNSSHLYTRIYILETMLSSKSNIVNHVRLTMSCEINRNSVKRYGSFPLTEIHLNCIWIGSQPRSTWYSPDLRSPIWLKQAAAIQRLSWISWTWSVKNRFRLIRK